MTPAKKPSGLEDEMEPVEANSSLHAEQLRLLFRFSLVGYLATLLVVFILGAILWDDLARPQLFAWFVAVAMVAIGRYLIYKAYIQSPPPLEHTRMWEGRFLAGTCLAGLCWMVIGTVLLPDRHAHGAAALGRSCW
jgi:hypothetical protein